jgi:hypothetical protein
VVRDARSDPLAACGHGRALPGVRNLVKKSKKRNTIRTPEFAGAGPLDWTPLFQAFEEAFDWALDVAAQLARDYPEEVEAVERVRAFMHARIAGEPAHASVEDILFTFGLIIGAIERDLGPIAKRTTSWVAPSVMRFPSAEEWWDRIVPRHVTGITVRIHPVHFGTT